MECGGERGRERERWMLWFPWRGESSLEHEARSWPPALSRVYLTRRRPQTPGRMDTRPDRKQQGRIKWRRLIRAIDRPLLKRSCGRVCFFEILIFLVSPAPTRREESPIVEEEEVRLSIKTKMVFINSTFSIFSLGCHKANKSSYGSLHNR